MSNRYIFNTAGKYVGFVANESLFDPLIPFIPPWRDVFEHASPGQSRPRLFPASGGFFPPLGTKFQGLLGTAIVAADGTFLGEVSRDRTAPNSILNQYGPYGSAYSKTLIFNDYSPYGGRYGALSPYNDYSTSPPRIVMNSKPIGLLSTNLYIGQAVNPDELLKWLQRQ
jgi:hypothetical protein